MTDDAPDLRASDADRERAAEWLRQAAGDGQITSEELEERLHAVYGARTCGELEPLTADLQASDARPVRRTGTFSVRPGGGGARWLVSIMAGRDRRGRWRLGRRCLALNLMGGSDLDLNHVELAADEVTLTVVSIMGGADIRVPEGLNVEVFDFAFMGGNGVDVGESHPVPGGPVLKLRLLSLMGGTDVKRGPKPRR